MHQAHPMSKRLNGSWCRFIKRAILLTQEGGEALLREKYVTCFAGQVTAFCEKAREDQPAVMTRINHGVVGVSL